jgi:hypothetical protein
VKVLVVNGAPLVGAIQTYASDFYVEVGSSLTIEAAEQHLRERPNDYSVVGILVNSTEKEATERALEGLFNLLSMPVFVLPPYVVIFCIGFREPKWEIKLKERFPLLSFDSAPDPVWIGNRLVRSARLFQDNYDRLPIMAFVHLGRQGTQCQPGEEIDAALLRNLQNPVKPDWQTGLSQTERIIAQYMAETVNRELTPSAQIQRDIHKYEFAIHYGENTGQYLEQFHIPSSSFNTLIGRIIQKIDRADIRSGLKHGQILEKQTYGREVYYCFHVRPAYIHRPFTSNP